MTPEIKKEYFEDNYVALMASYVAGTLSASENMIVASHLTLKPEARQLTFKMEKICGALLQHDVAPETLSTNCLASVLGRLDENQKDFYLQGGDSPSCSAKPRSQCHDLGFPIPEPAIKYLERYNQEFVWKKLLKGIEACEIETQDPHKPEFLRIAPGTSVPAHTHEGEEITLLLDGAFEDETGHYTAGDLIVLDERVEHNPVSDAKMGCVCLSVTTAPIKMTGPFMRLLNPFLK